MIIKSFTMQQSPMLRTHLLESEFSVQAFSGVMQVLLDFILSLVTTFSVDKVHEDVKS